MVDDRRGKRTSDGTSRTPCPCPRPCTLGTRTWAKAGATEQVDSDFGRGRNGRRSLPSTAATSAFMAHARPPQETLAPCLGGGAKNLSKTLRRISARPIPPPEGKPTSRAAAKRPGPGTSPLQRRKGTEPAKT